MLRISEDQSSGEVVILSLEGQVIGPWVAEVRRACEPVLAGGRRLALALAEVSFADRAAIALFKELIDRRVTIISCSPLIAEQLRSSAP
jgi:hypothetical protein